MKPDQGSGQSRQPMFWLITAAKACFMLMLLRTSLQHERDSYYSAIGGSRLIRRVDMWIVPGGSLDMLVVTLAGAQIHSLFWLDIKLLLN